jgi:hypothetical protein
MTGNQPGPGKPAKGVERDIAQDKAPGAGEAKGEAKRDIVRREGGREHPVR